jgi:Skp family chaperone for outer membrane proteins
MKTMKTLFMFLIFIAANSISAQSTFEKWPAIKNFHEVISQTFHPSEEGNLKPIKERSGEMVTKANALSTEAIPAEFKNEKILASIEKLKEKTASLDKLVKEKASDTDITKSLEVVHDEFHNIVGLCSETKH